MEERLERAGFADAERAEALERLRDQGYLDDVRAARERAGSMADRGHGDAAIRYDLGRRGVASDTIDEVLTALEPEGERAVRLARSLGGGVRAARSLSRKGFDGQSIERALGAVANDR